MRANELAREIGGRTGIRAGGCPAPHLVSAFVKERKGVERLTENAVKQITSAMATVAGSAASLAHSSSVAKGACALTRDGPGLDDEPDERIDHVVRPLQAVLPAEELRGGGRQLP